MQRERKEIMEAWVKREIVGRSEEYPYPLIKNKEYRGEERGWMSWPYILPKFFLNLSSFQSSFWVLRSYNIDFPQPQGLD